MAWWMAIPAIVGAIANKKANDNQMANNNAMTAASMQPGFTQAPAFQAMNPDPGLGRGMAGLGGGLFSRRQRGMEGGMAGLGRRRQGYSAPPLTGTGMR